MKKRAAKGETIVTGIVTPAAWDESFNVTSVKISASGEKDYLVDQQGKGNELIRCVREHLKVRGRVAQDAAGHRIITVEEFEKVEGEASAEG